MAGNIQPYRVGTFRDFVPHWLRYTLLIIFILIFQVANGVYLADIRQLVGAKVLLEEDIRMVLYASLIGMSLVFPLLFRIRLRFKTRDMLITVAAGIAICNVITMYTDNILLLMVANFIIGILRAVGTFECVSNMQPKLAASGNLTLMYCVVFGCILSGMQLSGIMTVWLGYYYNWQFMHIAITGMNLFILLCAFFLMKDIRFTKKIPLYGIDWMGATLLAVFLISAAFTLQYGKYFDWFDSVYIRIGTVVCIISLMLAIRRLLIARRPYYNLEIFRCKNFTSGFILLIAIAALLALQNTIQGTLTEGVLQYDSLNAISLNWFTWFGVIIGILLSWYLLAKQQIPYKWMLFSGISLIVSYHVIMYFVINPDINKEIFYLPNLLSGMGSAMLWVTITLYCVQYVPRTFFLQHVGFLSFVRTSLGIIIVASLLTNRMDYLLTKSRMLLGWQLDAVNTQATSLTVGQLYGEVMQQAMLVSLKELIGWFIIFGFMVLFLIATTKYVKLSIMSVFKKI